MAVVAHGAARVGAAGQAGEQLARGEQQVVEAQRRVQGPLAVYHQIAVVQQAVGGQHGGHTQAPGSLRRLVGQQAAHVVDVDHVGPVGNEQTQQGLGGEEAQGGGAVHGHAVEPLVAGRLAGVAPVQVLVGNNMVPPAQQRAGLELLRPAGEGRVEFRRL